MVNGLVPNYLCSLVPTTIDSYSTYNLRNSNDLSNIACKTNLYMNFFFSPFYYRGMELFATVYNGDRLSLIF